MAAQSHDPSALADLFVAIVASWAADARRNEDELRELADFWDMPADELRRRLASGRAGQQPQSHAASGESHKTKVLTRSATAG